MVIQGTRSSLYTRFSADIEGYNLDAAQLQAIVKLIGDEPHDPNYFYQLTCNIDDY